MGRVHLDIQPANILVFPKSRKSPYDVNFKLADFGLAVMQSGCAEDVVAIDNEGNRMYCKCLILIFQGNMGSMQRSYSFQLHLSAIQIILFKTESR